MTTTILYEDVIGTSFTKAEWDYSRFRAVRKFIVESTQTNASAVCSALTLNTSTGTTSTTLIGPRITGDFDGDGVADNNEEALISHNVQKDLPLQTLTAAPLGDRRWLVTADYYPVAGTPGQGGTAPQTLSLRTEVEAKRRFEVATVPDDPDGTLLGLLPLGLSSTDDIMKYSYLTTVRSLRIRLPFYSQSPPKIDKPMQHLSGVNSSNIDLLNDQSQQFPPRSLRFDGITLDEYGFARSDGFNTYRYRGHYEFTYRSDSFAEQTAVFSPANSQWEIREVFPSVDIEASWPSLAAIGL
ncbi:MAG: hypothetical protein GOVbin1630_5 [Prokaryotic dsDNA virus sp.]|nr:MAG: hypothetical protein GOVbin1630_5 [Prokaryotic dsDNA virus sp.]|tara:strand:+ start:20156 stop:21049 length:894 start_codon:yes stop_codon:yes gene_type:complete